MIRQRSFKIIIIVTLIISIMGISFGFAAFSNVLTISSSASVKPDSSDFSVKFSTNKDQLIEEDVSASYMSTGVTAENGKIDNNNAPTISNLSANFTEPGQYVEYTFYVRNEGKYTAYLNNINFNGTKVCEAGSETTQSYVDSACDAIDVIVTLADKEYSDTNSIIDHTLEKNSGEEVKVKISYDLNGVRADGPFNIKFGSISMVYSTIDDGGFVPPTGPSDGEVIESDKKKLYDVVKNGAQIDTDINFSSAYASSIVAGKYLVSGTENNSYPIYYYRGNVVDNNTLFANFCWKIVRTTETGGVKLIFNGVPENSQCNGTNSSIGSYKYNNSSSSIERVKYIGSNVKSYVDAWYETNMIDFASSLEDIPWCNDRSVFSQDDNGTITFGPTSRVWYTAKTISPSLSCDVDYQLSVSASNWTNRLKYPIALLSADEAVLAGSSYLGSDSTYLANGDYWFTLSPHQFFYGDAAYMINVCSRGALYHAHANTERSTRPAVSLKSGIMYSSGDGTSEKPYVIE